jgi:hypothetical protein
MNSISFQSAVGDPFEPPSPDELRVLGQSIVEHLRHESAYLDEVIACSQRMNSLLSRSSLAHSTSVAASQPTADKPFEPSLDKAQEQLDQIREELAQRFLPLAEGRQMMQSTIQKLETTSQSEPTLRALAAILDPSLRDELHDLRIEIKTKIQNVQAITMGNQAVLLHTLDFYNRLMTGISGETAPNQGYNSHGQMTNRTQGPLIQKHC